MAEKSVTCDLQMDRLQADNPFPLIPAATCSDRFMLGQRWCVFAVQADPVVEAVERRSPQHNPTRKRRRIIAVISEIDRDMLQRVWAEMNYRLDVCHVAKGGNIEHLW